LAAEFRRKFGREPGPEDPLFFDPDAETPQSLSMEGMIQSCELISSAMEAAGVDPSTVYAFRKTGLLPTKDTPLTVEKVREWNAAIDEFNSGRAQKHTSFGLLQVAKEEDAENG
jgi:hypothetical protein